MAPCIDRNTASTGIAAFEVGDDLVAERLVDLLHRPAGRHGEGAEAFDHLPALGVGALRQTASGAPNIGTFLP